MSNLLATLNIDSELDSGREDLESALLAHERRELKNSLHAFVKASWHLVEPAQPFVDNWHVRELCKVLEQVDAGKLKRVIINIPPGTMKSLLVSVFFQAWRWARKPSTRTLTAAYGSHLTIRDNLRVRDIVLSPWYQRLFPMALHEEQNTKTRFNTAYGGWRIATSVTGVGTGEHPDLIVIDDAATASDAESEHLRNAVIGWFKGTVSSRGVGRGVSIIVVGQRLHEEDLPGWLIQQGGWELVCWPMRYEKCMCPPDPQPDQVCPLHKADKHWKADPRDPRTQPGELMFPALFDEAKTAQLEKDLGPYGTAGQLQQRPSPEGGGLFKREDFQFCDVAPVFARRVRGWDTAATDAGGDYTVGCKISEELVKERNDKGRWIVRATGRFFVEDVQRDRLEPDGVDRLMKVTAELDGKQTPQREEREGGASGKAQIKSRKNLLKGFDYEEVQLGQNKRVRAKPLRAQVTGHNVFLVRGQWNEPFIQELCGFPAAKHDDQVDAASCAFNSLLLEPLPPAQSAVW